MVKNQDTSSFVSNTSNTNYNTEKQSFTEKCVSWFRNFLENAE